MNSSDFNLIDYIYVLAKRRKLIVLNFFIVCMIAVIISLLLPKWYEAKTVILPPEKEGIFLPLGSAAQFAAPLLGGGSFELPMFATSSDVYETILKSRRIAESIIGQFGFMEIYKSRNIDEAIEALANHTKIEVGRDGTIHLSFEAKEDPALAAKVANAYIKELDKVNKETSRSKARLTKEFMEKRLEETKVNLKKAEEALLDFQEKHNTISLPEQTQAAISEAAELYSRLMALRIELSVLRATMNESHAQVQKVKLQISEIDKMLNELKYGMGDENSVKKSLISSRSDELFIPFSKVPELGLELARRMREAKIQELLFELLTQQYEQAKIQETKDTPTIQILDKAVAPERKSRPKRAIIVIIAGVFSLFVSIFLSFYFEYLEKIKVENIDEYRKIQKIKNELKNDFRLFRKK